MSLFSGGDTDFIENLYDRHHREIYMICFSYCHNKADAEDCLQEVFVRALAAAGKIKKHPAPDKWLFVAARLVSLEKLSKNTKTHRREFTLNDFENALQSESFEDRLLEPRYNETEILLLRHDILEKLNKKEQELYILRYIDKSDVTGISSRLNVSYSNATTRLSRLKAKIIKLAAELFCD